MLKPGDSLYVFGYDRLLDGYQVTLRNINPDLSFFISWVDPYGIQFLARLTLNDVELFTTDMEQVTPTDLLKGYLNQQPAPVKNLCQ